jgi:hypothetical protein
MAPLERRTPSASLLLNRWLAGYGFVLAVLFVAVWDILFQAGAR